MYIGALTLVQPCFFWLWSVEKEGCQGRVAQECEMLKWRRKGAGIWPLISLKTFVIACGSFWIHRIPTVLCLFGFCGETGHEGCNQTRYCLHHINSGYLKLSLNCRQLSCLAPVGHLTLDIVFVVPAVGLFPLQSCKYAPFFIAPRPN